MVKVFVSHSHADKPIARRVAWRLAAYGISAWMDERGLRKGEALEPGVRKAIDTADAVVVIATKAAARSKWVRIEIAHAKARGKNLAIYPFFVDDVRKHTLFKTHLGISAMDSHLIEQRVFDLAKELGSSCSPSSVPNIKGLREALDLLKTEGSPIRLLIDGIVDGPGLPLQQAQTVVEVPFHVLDFTLNALYDVVESSGKDAVANLVASLFHRTGAGGYVLERYLLANRCSADADTAMLAIAVGRPLASHHLDEALRLLSISDPPNDQALVDFIRANNAVLSDEQWGIVIRLVTSPARKPGAFTQEAAFEVLVHKPDNESVRLLLWRWITDGQFDRPDSSYEFKFFVGLMSEAHQKDISSYGEIAQHLVRHIRSLVRSKDRAKVMIAIDHLMAVADKQCPFTADIARACTAFTGRAEWERWDDAEEMSIYVSAYAKAALNDQDWLEAEKEYKRTWEAVQAFEQMRKQAPK